MDKITSELKQSPHILMRVAGFPKSQIPNRIIMSLSNGRRFPNVNQTAIIFKNTPKIKKKKTCVHFNP